MIRFEKNPKVFNLVIESEGFQSLYNHRPHSKEQKNELYKLLSSIVSWRELKRGKYIQLSSLYKENLKNLSKVLKQEPLLGMILGSERNLTKIWTLYVHGNPYVIYYSKNGLVIEGNADLPTKDLLKDLKAIKTYMKP